MNDSTDRLSATPDPPAGPVTVVAGTRPEAVKVAPLVAALRRLGQPVRILDASQQTGRVAEALAAFGLVSDDALPIRRDGGGLGELVSLLVRAFDHYLGDNYPGDHYLGDNHAGAAAPAAVVVQGDTTTAFTAGLVASMHALPVVHLEAGLRTHDRRIPFPEETNRTLLADLATLHLAPTPRARDALAEEGHRGAHVVVTGNTAVDALEAILPAARRRPIPLGPGVLPAGGRLLVVTVHRREAWGDGVRTVARSVARLLDRHPDLGAVVVTHPNPSVAADVRAELAGAARCAVVDPLPYHDMLALLARANVALTDSGGIQEEAPSIGIPCVVAREVTERPEGVSAGWADLVGLSQARIVAAIDARLAPDARLPSSGNPYGDGHAAARCAQAIRWHLGVGERPADWVPPSPAETAPSP